LAVDAADPLSYPGSGTVLTDVSGNGFTGNVSSSISFVATNRGALYSANSSSAITFTGSAADFGSGSFTMEMAFTPQTINGQHFLYSKNSGSFPNFGAFLTGSNGSGRLVAFYNISSTISCSASTPTGSFVTGSNYIVDVTYAPSELVTIIYTNSSVTAQAGANGTGSLSTSASLFLLNNSTSSNVGSVANLYNFKVYNPNLGLSFIRKNYNAQAARFGLPLATYLPPAPLLLDTYSGAAAAYSLRKLRELYFGAAIRVRRSSDNTEADIGFNVNDELDTIALLAFCGAGNGFVKTWYDQSGNSYDATQITDASQPQIVSSGSVILDNSKPTILFDGVNDSLIKSSFTFSTTNLSIIKVNSRIGTSQNVDGIGYADAGTGGVQNANNSTRIGFQGRPNVSPFVAVNSGLAVTNNQVLQNNIIATTEMKASANGNAFATITISSPVTYSEDILRIGSVGSNLAFGNGNTSELILWNLDQSVNKTGIENNINSFYSIY
jgi:hypothetical protein